MATFPLSDIMTGSRTLNVKAVGTAADNAAASGNPVRVAAKYNSATQTYSDGDTADLQADVSGNLKTALMGRRAALPAPSNLDAALNVFAGGNTSVTITPAAGELWRVKLLRFSVPGIAAAVGNHTIQVWHVDSDAGILFARGAGTGVVQCFDNVLVGDVLETPSSDQAQVTAILGIVISNSLPLIVNYANDTDKTQSGTLTLRLVKEVEYIVS